MRLDKGDVTIAWGEDKNATLAEDEWAERFQQQAIEISALRSEIHRLGRQLDDTQRRLRSAVGCTLDERTRSPHILGFPGKSSVTA